MGSLWVLHLFCIVLYLSRWLAMDALGWGWPLLVHSLQCFAVDCYLPVLLQCLWSVACWWPDCTLECSTHLPDAPGLCCCLVFSVWTRPAVCCVVLSYLALLTWLRQVEDILSCFTALLPWPRRAHFHTAAQQWEDLCSHWLSSSVVLPCCLWVVPRTEQLLSFCISHNSNDGSLSWISALGEC